MIDELTLRIEATLAAHLGIGIRSTSRTTSRGSITDHERVCSGCGHDLPWSLDLARPAFTLHQAKQIRAVLAEVTP